MVAVISQTRPSVSREAAAGCLKYTGRGNAFRGAWTETPATERAVPCLGRHICCSQRLSLQSLMPCAQA
eukprot:scaffold926_cov408-Prasinococcus_capsulatus_cf.AAC.34